MDYVIDFCFCEEHSGEGDWFVYLLTGPEGKLDGTVAEMAPGEAAADAMVRAWKDRTGQMTELRDWHMALALVGNGWTVRVAKRVVGSKSDVPVEIGRAWYDVYHLPKESASVVWWVAPMLTDPNVRVPVTVWSTAMPKGWVWSWLG